LYFALADTSTNADTAAGGTFPLPALRGLVNPSSGPRADAARIWSMSDESIVNHIEQLMQEESALRRSEQQDSASPERLEDDAARLRSLEVELDRCWDLLRQRRALRDAGANPDDAEVRDSDVVERYLQ
jgi:hypothetical protein